MISRESPIVTQCRGGGKVEHFSHSWKFKTADRYNDTFSLKFFADCLATPDASVMDKRAFTTLDTLFLDARHIRWPEADNLIV